MVTVVFLPHVVMLESLSIAGNILGSGIYVIPSNLSSFGSISVLSWLITFVGVTCLSLVFAKSEKYSVKNAFSSNVQKIVSVAYLSSAVVGNVATAIVCAGYLGFEDGSVAPIFLVVVACALNLQGRSLVLRIQSLCTLGKLLCLGLLSLNANRLVTVTPIVTLVIVGWSYFDWYTLSSSWNVR